MKFRFIGMTNLEAAVQKCHEDGKFLEQLIIEHHCPHDFGLKDGECGLKKCKECWEVEQ